MGWTTLIEDSFCENGLLYATFAWWALGLWDHLSKWAMCVGNPLIWKDVEIPCTPCCQHSQNEQCLQNSYSFRSLSTCSIMTGNVLCHQVCTTSKYQPIHIFWQNFKILNPTLKRRKNVAHALHFYWLQFMHIHMIFFW